MIGNRDEDSERPADTAHHYQDQEPDERGGGEGSGAVGPGACVAHGRLPHPHDLQLPRHAVRPGGRLWDLHLVADGRGAPPLVETIAIGIGRSFRAVLTAGGAALVIFGALGTVDFPGFAELGVVAAGGVDDPDRHLDGPAGALRRVAQGDGGAEGHHAGTGFEPCPVGPRGLVATGSRDRDRRRGRWRRLTCWPSCPRSHREAKTPGSGRLGPNRPKNLRFWTDGSHLDNP